MHEYLLYAHVPAVREKQVLSILTAITGSQAVRVCEQVLIYAQTKLPDAPVSKKQPQSKQQNPKQLPVPSYHKLVREVHLHDDAAIPARDWCFRAEQVPEPGIQAYISRGVTEQPATPEQILRFKDPAYYRYHQQYTLIGNRFVHDDVVVRVLRFHTVAITAPSDVIDAPPCKPAEFSLVDESESLVIESVVRVEDASNSTVAAKAKEELVNFQAFMDGAIDFYAPDRLCLDTRVRS